MARSLALEQDREAWLEKTVDMIQPFSRCEHHDHRLMICTVSYLNQIIRTGGGWHSASPPPKKIITNQPPAFRTSTRAARAGGIIRIWHTHKGN